MNQYYYSLNGNDFTPLGLPTQLTWGSYRGDRIGIFSYNTQQEKGFIDVDFVKYLFKR